jgi:hypothetical protein
LSPEPLLKTTFWVQVISVIQSSVLLMILLGGVFAKRVNLATPIIDRLCGVSANQPRRRNLDTHSNKSTQSQRNQQKQIVGYQFTIYVLK